MPTVCPNTECHQEANLWLAGWLDDDHAPWRLEDGWWDVACWPLEYSVATEKGQGKLMGSIHCTQIPFILIAINQSHLSPLSLLYSANPLVDPKTHASTSTIKLFFVMITSYHTFISQSWQFCLLSAPLWFHSLHTPYCYLFLANLSMHCPALNYWVYN